MPPSKDFDTQTAARPVPTYDHHSKKNMVAAYNPGMNSFAPQVVPSNDEASVPSLSTSKALGSPMLNDLGVPFEDSEDIPPGTICPAALANSITAPDYQVPSMPSPPRTKRQQSGILLGGLCWRGDEVGSKRPADNECTPPPKRMRKNFSVDVISVDERPSPFLTSYQASPFSQLNAPSHKRVPVHDMRLPRCTHVGCEYTPRVTEGTRYEWRALVRQVVAHERDRTAHSAHVFAVGDSCGCCQMLTRTAAWDTANVWNDSDDESDEVYGATTAATPTPTTTTSTTYQRRETAPHRHDLAAAHSNQTVACGHDNCGFLSRAGSYHNRKNNVRFHEKNVRLHVEHIRQSLRDGLCGACQDLISAGVWSVQELKDLVANN